MTEDAHDDLLDAEDYLSSWNLFSEDRKEREMPEDTRDKSEVPNCAKCKWSRLREYSADEQREDNVSLFGIRLKTVSSQMVCIAQGGAPCVGVFDKSPCRKLYEVDPVRLAELAGGAR